jgi:capsular polysaccharide transport system permease protein
MDLKVTRASWRADHFLPLIVAGVTLIVALYFAFWASDVYVSESRFVVRSPERAAAGGLGNLLLQGVGFNKAPDDAVTVREFILSRDALQALQDRLNVKALFSNEQTDFLSRFAGLDRDNSFEALHRYFQHKVDVQADSNSSIVTLTVRAFRPKDASNINKVLLEQSEELVNRLNARGRSDMVRFAQVEVAAAEKKVAQASLALSKYRNKERVLDPEKQATAQLQQVSRLEDDLVATNTQLLQLQAVAPANPQIGGLKTRARSLQAEIARLKSGLTGGEASLSSKAGDYQQVALEAEFAAKQLTTALASLEHARNEAQRKQFYLERIAGPSLPDSAQEPKRLRQVFATVMMALVAWGVLSMLLAGLREHRD